MGAHLTSLDQCTGKALVPLDRTQFGYGMLGERVRGRRLVRPGTFGRTSRLLQDIFVFVFFLGDYCFVFGRLEITVQNRPRIFPATVGICFVVLLGGWIVMVGTGLPPALLGARAAECDVQKTLSSTKTDKMSSEQKASDALHALGARLKTDDQGQVVLVELGEGKASDSAARWLRAFPQLKSLRWTGPQVTDATVEVLRGLPKLTVLKLDETKLTDAGLAQIKPLARLEELYLARTQITDAGMDHLAELRRLRRLRLSETKITGTGLAKIVSLQELVELDISKTAIDDAALVVLEKLPRLTRLNLYTTPITDAGLDHLAPLVQLTWLNLDNTRITDAGLPKLRALKKLEFLHLGRTQITDAGLGPLAELTQLKTLHLTNTRVTVQGAAQLQKALPGCKILVGATGDAPLPGNAQQDIPTRR